jgi:colanic acid/amylovoran biosynthesis glycosyltransferase
MKIALVLSSTPQYSETFFNALIHGLQNEGYDVTLYTGKSDKSWHLCKQVSHPVVHKSYFIQMVLMLYTCFTLLPHLKRVMTFFGLEKKYGTPIKRIIEKIYLNAALLKFNGDWIHFGFATTALQREFVPAAAGAQMAVSLRGYDINVYPLKHPNCYKVLWAQVDKVHSISRYLLNEAYQLGLDRSIPFGIIPPAVNFKNLPKPIDHLNNGTFKIVTIARFNWIKGLEFLTEVALRLKNKDLDFEWTLIGSGTSNEKERFLFDLNHKQLRKQLFHKGQCSHEETLDILKDSDLYVQTSLNEGFCNAVLEAQAIGLPCIAFKVGGIPENISDMETGWLIEPYDVEAMADQIIAALALSGKEKALMSKQATKRVQEHFNLEQQQQAFYEFYRT